jgi:hypothetical protein
MITQDVDFRGKVLLGQGTSIPTPALGLNIAWNGSGPAYSKLGRWSGNVNGGNIILRIVFALADYETANSIGELTVHYTLGRTQPCTNVPSAVCYGDGFVLTTCASVQDKKGLCYPCGFD